MVTIAPTRSYDNKMIVWDSLTENDTATPAVISSGLHTVEMRGTFGDATVDLQFGFDSSDMAVIDTQNPPDGLRFQEQGAVNVELGGGYVNPVATGGTSQSLTITIVKVD